MSPNTIRQAAAEYIVVGSGAGGGTVAARLAEAGRTVLLLEAGSDPRNLSGGDAVEPGGNRVDGVLYPRAGTLGGCTAHNAMILVYPHNDDWDQIARLTSDPSWSAENMRSYFERLENCQYRAAPYRLLGKIGIDSTRHGWKGWLQTEAPIPAAALRDKSLKDEIIESALQAFKEIGQALEQAYELFEGQCDPNDWQLVCDNAVGIRYTPLTTRNHQRIGTRERVVETAQKYPNNLRIELNALVTRVLIDGGNRAYGVEYLSGERLYRAHNNPSQANGERREIYASREVILAGGAFNTPQLLMLSGVGPRDVLQRDGIQVRAELPGVGKNLQDRYEVGVVNRMNFDHWGVLEGAKYNRSDPMYQQWASGRTGVYMTNGACLAVIKRAAPERPLPDLFCFALLGMFRGYFPGYSTLIPKHLNYLTWAILKAHTNNRAGEVTLRSADPRDMPDVNFRYFEEGSDAKGEDLNSVVDGIKFVRSLTANLKKGGA